MDTDLTCPDLAWAPWWNAAVVYADMGEADPEWRIPILVRDADGHEMTVKASADEMSLFHCFLFWGYHDGRL